MTRPDPKHSSTGIEFFGGYEVQDASGVDLTTLRRNLALSLEDRLENNRSAAEAFESLRRSLAGQEQIRRRPFMLDIPGLIQRLIQSQVEFVVIGGVAMVAHGSNHSTRDVDLCYNRSAENLTRLAAVLTDLHAYLRGAPKGLPFRTDVPTLQAGLNFTLEPDCGDLVLIGEVAGVGGFAEVLAASEEKEMFGERVRVLSLDGLIAAKRAAWRAKDQSHLLELESLKKLRDAGQ